MSKKVVRVSCVRHALIEPLEQRIAPATFTVVNVNDAGTGSLRDAINLSNATRAFDTINFAIPGTGLHTIVLQSTLPDITSPVIIDGYSQPGSAVNTLSVGDNAQLRIELNGSLTTAAVGLTVSAGNSTVRGLVINNFDSDGIRINTLGANTINGNFIGTDSTGTADLGNGGLGVSDASSSSGNTIGGAAPALRNIISGNDSQGINLSGDSNNVLGNYVGTDATGTADLGNLRGGIVVGGATNTIGGAASGAGNVISGNDGHGVDIAAGTANGTIVGGNFIGTDAGGAAPLKNNGTGVFISAGANSVIGGAAPNTIAFNGLDGVAVLSLSGAGHSIRGNSIFSNGGLGINLQPSPELAGTVTPNDPGDGDSGPNALQNFPVITAVSVTRGITTVAGTLNSTPSTFAPLSFAIDIYANTATDATGFGEGQTYLGSTTVTTNPSGNAAFSFSTPTALSNVFFTATATPANSTPNTSEFSAAQEIPGSVVNTTADVVAADGLTSFREAINYSNATSGAQTISFNIPGSGVQSIAVTSALPTISGPVVIDGYTQPGASASTLGADFGTNATLLIELNGAAAGAGVNGLTLNGSGSIVRGLVIDRFAGDGINSSGISGSAIEGNFIGTNAFGTAALGNGGNGIFLDQSFNNTIGGTTPAARNLIAGNSSAGVRIEGQVTDNNIVAGNLIGTNAAGNAILGTELTGVALGNIASGNIIGGTTAAARNVIAGSSGHGITLNGVNGNTIQGNYIGTDVTGTLALGNSGSGIFISTSGNNVIGSATPGAGNLIANNGLDGIALATDAFNANAIRGNRIFGNGDLGIDLRNDGVTANDARDGDSGPNSLQNYPVITSASVTGGSTTVSGTLNSVGSTTFTIELFANNVVDPSGFGEGEIFIGSSSVTTDANGDGSFTFSTPTAYTNLFLSATAIADNGDTSEFAQSVRATRVATSFVWDGSAGDLNWFTSANWTPDGVPGASDTAILNISSAINLPSDTTVASFQQSNGTLGGGGKLTIATSGTFSGGVLAGPGITFIPVGSVFDISGTTDKQIDGRTLALAGTVTFSGTGNLRTEFDGTIDIQTGGFFDVQSDVSLVAFGGSGFGFVKNAGTFQKSGGTGTTAFSNGGQNVTLDNSGIVRALTGEILIPHGGSSTAGTFAAAAGAFIDFNGGYSFGDGTQFTGAGEVRLLSGNQTLSGAISSTSLVLEGATITGTQSITGDTKWIAGTIGGAPGTTTIPAGSTLEISGPADKQLESRTLDLRGTATLNGAGNLFPEFDSVLDIHTGALFDVQSDVSLVARGGAGFGTVNNAGTFQKSGGNGTTSFSNGGQTVTLNNSGLVGALTGTILVAHGGTSTGGQFNAVPGALIDFNAGYTFNAGTQFTGGGEVRLLAGTHALSGAISSANLKLAGATITGTQTISGNLEWRSGSLAGGTTLPSGATVNLVGPAEKLLDGGSVTNLGTIIWGGTGNWRMAGGAAINNLAGGTFEIQSDASMSIGGGDGNGTFINAGLVRKATGAGTTSIGGGQGPSFTNSGTIDVTTGTLAFQLSFTQTGGATQLSGGNLGGAILFAYEGGELGGAGTITGGVSNTGATVRPGNGVGVLAITGNYTQGANGTLAFEASGTGPGEFDQLGIGGNATLGGTLDIDFLGAFVPVTGDTFRVVQSANNPGSFATLTGDAAGIVQQPDATGLVIASAGSLFRWDAGAGNDTSWFNPINWDHDSGVPGTSDTAVLDINATINLPGNTTVGGFQQSNGTFTSPVGVNFTVSQSFNWSGGTQSGAGATTIDAAAALNLSGAADKTLSTRTLNNSGAVTFSGAGSFYLSGGAVVNNSGMFAVKNDAIFVDSVGATSTFNNLAGGTFRKSGAIGVTQFGTGNGVVFNNSGTLDVQSGTLQLLRGGAGTAGVFSAAPAATVEYGTGVYTQGGVSAFQGGGLFLVSGATVSLADGSVLSGTGTTMRVTGGTLTLTGTTTAQVGTFFEQSGGSVDGAGTLAVDGVFNWSGGTQSGAGATTIDAGAALNLSGAADKTLSARILNNAGTATFTGAGSFDLSGGATINNSGLFEVKNDASFVDGVGATSTFNNLAGGTFRKSGATGVTQFGTGNGVVFNNSGTLDGQSGTLQFNGAFIQTSGTTALSGGALATTSSLALQGGELRGAGTITGNVNNTGAIVRPGGSNAAGSLTVTADYTQASGATLEIEIGGATAGTQYDQLSVGGTATLGGNLNVAFINGFTPAAGNVFNVVSAGSRTGTFSNVIGAGSFTANYTTTQAQLLQAGSVFVWDAGGGADTSWFTTANWDPDGVPGATDSATLNINATINLPSDARVATFNQANGTLTSPANVTFTILNSFSWTGGGQSGAGITTVPAGATLTYSTSGQPTPLNQRTLNLDGASIFPSSVGGEIALSNGAVINNSGMIDFQGPIIFSGSGTINNLGGATLTNTTSNHSVVVSNGIAFTNAGLVKSQIGTLGFNGGYVQTAGSTELSGGSIAVSGTLNLNGGALTGTGMFVGSINNSGGIVRPGGAGVAGTITTNGDYIQGPGGTLETELGGSGPGQFDIFAVGGVASLGGTLTAPQIAGFTPPSGSQFQTITAGSSISGTFNTEPANVGIQYAPKSVTLLGPAPLPGLVVTTKLDVVDPEDGFTSLREAILFANQNPGVDTIVFNIPGNGVQTIEPSSPLPTLTDAVVIDGYTQPGSTLNTLAKGSDAALRIELSGTKFAIPNGLILAGGSSSVRGLIINGFMQDGLVVNGAGSDVIAGNWIGLAATGSTAVPNGRHGILLNADDVTIGGTAPGARNVISGNIEDGISFGALGDSGTLIEGNFIGTDSSGTVAAGNRHGIEIAFGANNTIGGPLAGQGNLISGNRETGLFLSGGDANVVTGNLIGTDVSGRTALGNSIGVKISDSTNNLVGGTAAGAGNLISGNTLYAIAIGGSTGSGIGSLTTGNAVQGNTIGLNTTGNAALPNLGAGIAVIGAASRTTIGGTAPGARNIISGNRGPGVLIQGSSIYISDTTSVIGNFIGTDATGTGAFGNAGDGIALKNGTTSNTIGGFASPAGNTIVFNAGAGVSVDSTSQRNAIRGNSIHNNIGLGIDLGSDGPTANDQRDLDSGANGLQNFPVLTALQSVAGGTRILGTLNSTPNMEFIVQFFVADAAGQGRTLLGSIDVNTDGNGNGSIDTTVSTALGNSDSVTATATSQNNDTSEFAAAVGFTGAAIRISDVAVTEGQSGTVNAVFTLTLSAPVKGNVSVNFSTADLTATAANNDYVPLNGTATFAPNQLTTTVSITVNGDTSGETRERFVVNLSNAVNARIDDGQGIGVILDDDHHLLVTGSGDGSLVRVFDATTGRLDASFEAFEPEFRGGVRVATGDVNGDGVNDIIAGAGLAGGGRVRVFDGVTHEPLPGVGDFNAFGRFYRGGVYVAAGDVNGDGLADIIVSPSAGGSGQVRVFNGADGAELSRFTVFGKGSGGVRVAAGDVNGDGRADVIAGAGLGSSVRIFDALAGTLLPGEQTEFRAFGKAFRGGVYVAAGDVNGDGLDDVIVSQAADGKTFRVFPSALPESAMLEHDAYSGALRGVRVGTVDVNSDGLADIIAGKGSGGDTKVTVFDGGTLARLLSLSGYRTHGHLGVFVG